MYLVARLRYGGFSLLDTQFVTEHLKRFGAIEVSRKSFHEMLGKALQRPADFWLLPREATAADIVRYAGGDLDDFDD
jgi:leucyl/phenylalanyl-tRNA---protein transferase